MVKTGKSKNKNEMNKEIKALVKKFKTHCRKNGTVFNKELERNDYSEIEHIFAGDNPGESEKKAEKYMVEDSKKRSSVGNNAHRFFKWMGIEKKVLILNKSSIYTDKTKDLRGKNKELLKIDLEFMAEFIFDLHKIFAKYNKPVSVFITGLTGCYDPEDGWLKKIVGGDYRANQFMHAFWEKLIEKYEDKDKLREHLFITKHFAYWKIFDDFVWTENGNNSRIIASKRVKMTELESNYTNDESIKLEVMKILKSLDYKNQLFK